MSADLVEGSKSDTRVGSMIMSTFRVLAVGTSGSINTSVGGRVVFAHVRPFPLTADSNSDILTRIFRNSLGAVDNPGPGANMSTGSVFIDNLTSGQIYEVTAMGY